MENLLAKMKEYLAMDSEIDFTEFGSYYKQLMDYLLANYENMDKDALCRAKFILGILAANSGDRAHRKGANVKKYKKMQEKTNFWSNAINFRLQKEGMSQQEIDEQVEKINKSCTDSKSSQPGE